MKKYFLYFCLLAFGFGLGYYIKPDVKQNSIPFETSESAKATKSDHRESNTNKNDNNIPAKVTETLAYIDANNEAPANYVGGRTFKNLEQLLPKNNSSGNKISYREWDVNPKVQGRNRGAERLVTGNDKSAYFTNDHYNSFKKIR